MQTGSQVFDTSYGFAVRISVIDHHGPYAADSPLPDGIKLVGPSANDSEHQRLDPAYVEPEATGSGARPSSSYRDARLTPGTELEATAVMRMRRVSLTPGERG